MDANETPNTEGGEQVHEDAVNIDKFGIPTKPKPWPDVVDGLEVMGEAVSLYKTHFVLPKLTPELSALYDQATHSAAEAYNFPIMDVTSPTEGCAKTNYCELHEAFCYRPYMTDGETAASIKHLTNDAGLVTLLLNEAEHYINGLPPQSFNSRFAKRRGQSSMEQVNGRWQRTVYANYGPTIVAHIGELREKKWRPFLSRSIKVQLTKLSDAELDADREYKGEFNPEIHDYSHVQRKMARWSLDNKDRITELARKQVRFPGCPTPRFRQTWQHMWVLGEVLGGEWPETVGQLIEKYANRASRDDDELTALSKAVAAVLPELVRGRSATGDRVTNCDLCEAVSKLDDFRYAEQFANLSPPSAGRRLAAHLNDLPEITGAKKIGSAKRGYLVSELTLFVTRYGGKKISSFSNSLTREKKKEMEMPGGVRGGPTDAIPPELEKLEKLEIDNNINGLTVSSSPEISSSIRKSDHNRENSDPLAAMVAKMQDEIDAMEAEIAAPVPDEIVSGIVELANGIIRMDEGEFNESCTLGRADLEGTCDVFKSTAIGVSGQDLRAMRKACERIENWVRMETDRNRSNANGKWH